MACRSALRLKGFTTVGFPQSVHGQNVPRVRLQTANRWGLKSTALGYVRGGITAQAVPVREA